MGFKFRDNRPAGSAAAARRKRGSKFEVRRLICSKVEVGSGCTRVGADEVIEGFEGGVKRLGVDPSMWSTCLPSFGVVC